MARRWRWTEHINVGELRAGVIWLAVLIKAMDLRRHDLLDASDNSVTACCTGHGRSSSPHLNGVLQKRTALEAISDAHLKCTWTSTFFQPADLGTRLIDGDPLLGVVVRPLSIACRLIIIGGIGGSLFASALKALGWNAVLYWDLLHVKKYDLNTARARGTLESLTCSGHVLAIAWFLCNVPRTRRLDDDGAPGPWSTDLTEDPAAAPEAQQSVKEAFEAVTTMCPGALTLFVCDETQKGAPVAESISVFCPHQAVCWRREKGKTYRLKPFVIRSSVRGIADLSLLPDPSLPRTLAFQEFEVPEWQRRAFGGIGEDFCHEVLELWQPALRRLHAQAERPAADRPARLRSHEIELQGRLPAGARLISSLPHLLQPDTRNAYGSRRLPPRVESG
jgi:hypothetical protein